VRLKAQQRKVKPFKLDRADSEAEVIEDFPPTKEQVVTEGGKGIVQGMVHKFESRGTGTLAKLPLQPANPLRTLPPKSSVCPVVAQ
jgi:hypothetical protein